MPHMQHTDLPARRSSSSRCRLSSSKTAILFFTFSKSVAVSGGAASFFFVLDEVAVPFTVTLDVPVELVRGGARVAVGGAGGAVDGAGPAADTFFFTPAVPAGSTDGAAPAEDFGWVPLTVAMNSEAVLSSGDCLDCFRKFYPGY